MSQMIGQGSTTEPQSGAIPRELAALQERVLEQPQAVREALGPLVEEALEDARLRYRVLTMARDALQQFRLDLQMARFDLEATRREREALRARLAARNAN